MRSGAKIHPRPALWCGVKILPHPILTWSKTQQPMQIGNPQNLATHLGMAMGRGRAGRGGAGPKDEVFVPTLYSFVFPHPHPILPNGENFLTPPRPLEPHEALPTS